MKPTILAACLLPVLAVAAIYGSTPAQAVEYLEPASVYDGGPCYLYDRYGNLYQGDTWSISQNNGSYSASCKVKGAFGSGPNTKFANFTCYTSVGMATKVYEQIDSKGNATMTCQLKLSDGSEG